MAIDYKTKKIALANVDMLISTYQQESSNAIASAANASAGQEKDFWHEHYNRCIVQVEKLYVVREVVASTLSPRDREKERQPRGRGRAV